MGTFAPGELSDFKNRCLPAWIVPGNFPEMKVPVQAHDACFSGISREIFHGHLLGFNLTENELVNKTGKFQGKGAFLVISQVGLGVVVIVPSRIIPWMLLVHRWYCGTTVRMLG